MLGVSARAGWRTSSRPSASRRISRSEVSRICAALDAEVEAFRCRPLDRRGVSRTCGSTRRTSRSARRAGWCRWRRSSRPAWRRPASGGCWASSSRAGNDEGIGLAGVHPRRSSSAASRGVRLVISDDHRGPRQGGPRAAPGRGLAALPGPLHAQRPGPRAALAPGAWSRRPSARSSSSPTRRSAREQLRPGRSTASRPRFPAVAELLDRRPRPTCSSTSRSPRPTAARSAAPTRRSGSTRRSSAGPRWSGSSPTRASVIRLVGHGPRRAGRRVAGRPALLPARDDGRHRRRRRTRGGGPGAADGELTDQARG